MRQMLILSLALTIMSSCSLFKSNKQDKQDFSEYEKGVVLNKTGLDGCTYIIKLASGKKLEPINLTNEFKRDQFTVWVKYEPKKGMASICMVGTMVEIIDIQKRTEQGKKSNN